MASRIRKGVSQLSETDVEAGSDVHRLGEVAPLVVREGRRRAWCLM